MPGSIAHKDTPGLLSLATGADHTCLLAPLAGLPFNGGQVRDTLDLFLNKS